MALERLREVTGEHWYCQRATFLFAGAMPWKDQRSMCFTQDVTKGNIVEPSQADRLFRSTLQTVNSHLYYQPNHSQNIHKPAPSVSPYGIGLIQ